MRLEQLEALLAIKKTHSMNIASLQLHISQQAVSHAIKDLEAELGCQLLTTSNKGSFLTPAGEIVIESAEDIFAAVSTMQGRLDALKQVQALEPQCLHLGLSYIAEQLYMPLLFHYYQTHLPHYQLKMATLSLKEIFFQLLNGQIDAACLTLDDDEKRQLSSELLFVPLYTCRPYISCADDSVLAKKKKITLNDLTEASIIISTSTTDESYAFKLLKKYGLQENIMPCSSNDSSFLKRVIENNIAVGLVFTNENLNTQAHSLAKGGFIPLLAKEYFQFGYLLRKDKAKTIKAAHLQEALNAVCGQ